MLSDQEDTWSLEKTRIDPVHKLQINLEYIDFEIRPSGDDNYYLEYQLDGDEVGPEYENPLTYQVSGDTLSVKEEYESGSYHVHVDIGFLSGLYSDKEVHDYRNVVTLYVPEDSAFAESTIVLGDGDMDADGLNVRDTDITLDYGDLSLADSTLAACNISMSDGSVEATGLSIEEAVQIKSNYGDVDIQLASECADDISLDLSAVYGDVEVAKNIQGDKMMDSDEDIVRFERDTGSSGTLKIVMEDGNIKLR